MFFANLKNPLLVAEVSFRRLEPVFRVIFPSFALLFLVVLFYHLIFLNRIYPGVVVTNIPLDGKTVTQAQLALLATIVTPEKVILKGPESQEYEMKLSDLSFFYDFKGTAENAFSLGRKENPIVNIAHKTKLLWQKQRVPLAYHLDGEALEKQIATISAELKVLAVEPSISIKNKEVVLIEGKLGQEVDVSELKTRIHNLLANNTKDSDPLKRVEIPLHETGTQISETEAEVMQKTAKKLIGKRLSLTHEFNTFSYPDNELVKLINPKGGFDERKIKELVSEAASKVNREPQNAVFVFKDNRVQEFKPGKDGVTVKDQELVNILLQKLAELLETDNSLTLGIPFAAAPPKISTAEVNNLGIKELVGRGASSFRGSIPGRVHNVGLASGRISGTLVKPGETFSFAQTLGDVSAFTGYKQAYIIQEGRTILGDGGGVCQVSTTLFRAALNAGLPIVERNQHSYRVSYYEQDSKPGIDATVYVPSIDLKFKNDTPGHLLIQSFFDPKALTLVFELYGTGDGRVASISTPQVWGVVPPPAPLYQDDPSLPLGTTRQVDFAAWGSKASFEYKVTRGDEVLQDRTFYSNYRPWQAIYLRGTATQ